MTPLSYFILHPCYTSSLFHYFILNQRWQFTQALSLKNSLRFYRLGWACKSEPGSQGAFINTHQSPAITPIVLKTQVASKRHQSQPPWGPPLPRSKAIPLVYCANFLARHGPFSGWVLSVSLGTLGFMKWLLLYKKLNTQPTNHYVPSRKVVPLN